MSAVAVPAFHYHFPRSYEIKLLESYSLVNPVEELHQFPARLEEGDRTGIYLRITPGALPAWVGFFAKGFDSSQVASGIYSCPDPDSLCVVAGGYAYMVKAADPESWVQIEQRPVVLVKPLPELKLLLFVGFTTISGLGESGRLWTTHRLSWEGISIASFQGTVLHGLGWDMMTDKEVPFEVDLVTGESKGGARPQAIIEHGDTPPS
jgi:hypothetical protein